MGPEKNDITTDFIAYWRRPKARNEASIIWKLQIGADLFVRHKCLTK